MEYNYAQKAVCIVQSNHNYCITVDDVFCEGSYKRVRSFIQSHSCLLYTSSAKRQSIFCISVRRRYFMSVSYKKLWKLLIDKDMKKKDLCERAGISPASVTKMGRNGHVTTEILVKICAAPVSYTHLKCIPTQGVYAKLGCFCLGSNRVTTPNCR